MSGQPYQPTTAAAQQTFGQPRQPMGPMGYVVMAQGAYVGTKMVLVLGVVRTLLVLANIALFFYLAVMWFIAMPGLEAFVGFFVILMLSIIPGRFIARIGTRR